MSPLEAALPAWAPGLSALLLIVVWLGARHVARRGHPGPRGLRRMLGIAAVLAGLTLTLLAIQDIT